MANKTVQFIQNIGMEVKLWQYNREFRQNEYFVGIRPTMQNFGQFLHGHESSNINEGMQRSGIEIRANDYWTFGPATEIGSSSRFDPTSKLYQAWFGIYTHRGADGSRFGVINNEPDIGLLKRIAEVGQEYWLRSYGDINPLAKLMKFEGRGKLKIDGNNAWMYYGEIDSHSDVGLVGRSYDKPYRIARSRRFTSSEKIDEQLFVPNPILWDGTVTPYHSVKLKGLFAVVPFDNSVACIYLNGVEYQDNEKRHHDTWPVLRLEARNMIESVKITQLTRK